MPRLPVPPVRLSRRDVRRLALARAGLLRPAWTGLPGRASGRGRRARKAAHRVIERFGYLQVDSVPVSGARTHGIVLASRLEGFDASVAEELLRPGEPLFEYWGHEASWIPLALYPAFDFRRREELDAHRWYGDLLGTHPRLAEALLSRAESGGPLTVGDARDLAEDMGASRRAGRLVLVALWSAGLLAVRERSGFRRIFDLAERVIPVDLRRRPMAYEESLRILLARALAGHGWATTGTLAATWRLQNRAPDLVRALAELSEAGEVSAAELEHDGRRRPGWVRTADLALLDRLRRARPRSDRGVLLSPFDPVLWDRPRVALLFDFDQVLEIYKPAADRRYGYYCMPVLAGERLVGRVDLKAERAAGRLRVVSCRFERPTGPTPIEKEAARSAIDRFARAVGLEAEGGP